MCVWGYFLLPAWWLQGLPRVSRLADLQLPPAQATWIETGFKKFVLQVLALGCKFGLHGSSQWVGQCEKQLNKSKSPSQLAFVVNVIKGLLWHRC
jgi:hypothetical protein